MNYEEALNCSHFLTIFLNRFPLGFHGINCIISETTITMRCC